MAKKNIEIEIHVNIENTNALMKFLKKNGNFFQGPTRWRRKHLRD